MIKVGINGFGRIGRAVFRIMDKNPNIEVVAINDLIDADYMSYLLKYDSVSGRFDKTVEVVDGHLVVDGRTIRVTAQKNPADINWGALNVDIVVESTGIFLTTEKSMAHIEGGAKKVILSAPPKDETPMFVFNVNHKDLNSDLKIISNASCTTNCLTPLLKVIHENFGIVEGLMTTVHSVTAGQGMVDGPAKDRRRGRSGLENIVPTTTGAAKAATKIMPNLKGKVNGMAMRVPTIDGSVIDLTVRVEKATSMDEINAAIKKTADSDMKGTLEFSDDALVSRDIVGYPVTSLYDSAASMELNENFFKLITWYDNEWGYSSQLVKMVEYWGKL